MPCWPQSGDLGTTIKTETSEIRDHLYANPDQLRAALAIYDAWPTVRDEECERFLSQLRAKLEVELKEKLPRFADQLISRQEYEGDKRYSNLLFVGLNGRPRYEFGIQSFSQRGPNGWMWGVSAPVPYHEMEESDKSVCLEVAAALKRHGLALKTVKDPPYHWPQYEYVRKFRDWDPLTPDLHEECREGGGPITDYFVEGLIGIANSALPAIDEVTGGGPAS